MSTYIVNRDLPVGLNESYVDLAYTLARLCRTVIGTETKLKLIETSFYGQLKPFANWLLAPVVSALSNRVDRAMDPKGAAQFLQDMGVDYADREVDNHKGYANSITVDLTGSLDTDHLIHASVRGTVAENNLMVSRINDFDKLYFEPSGHIVGFTYKDRPGVLAQITTALAKAGINIDDTRNPHDSKGENSIAILKVNQPVPANVIAHLSKDIQAKAAFSIELKAR
jgi:D-3-phosphoglycerate dehydrogenase